MIDADKLVDKFSGFITREQAEKILKGEMGSESRTKNSRAYLTVKELLSDMKSAGQNNERLEEEIQKTSQLVNIKDRIYRIFNPSITVVNGRETARRHIILGEEGSTIRLSLKGNLSEFMDINAFERGDDVSISNVMVDQASAELRSGQNTVINKISPSKFAVINDFSFVREEMRKVDVFGRIIEINPIRHVSKLGAGQIPIASCTITDSRNSVEASLWGSSALRTATMKTNDYIKIEFCNLKVRNERMQIYADDYSRVLTGNSIAQRLR